VRLVTLLILSLAIVACNTSDPNEPVIETGALLINEFLASNTSTNEDENGEFDDWVELYNGTDAAIDIAGMYITDDPTDSVFWQIPYSAASITTISAGGFLLLWCDEQPEQGPNHVDIKLSKDGESIILIDSDGITVIDSLVYYEMVTGVSMGRIMDGGETWGSFSIPTPGFSNE